MNAEALVCAYLLRLTAQLLRNTRPFMKPDGSYRVHYSQSPVLILSQMDREDFSSYFLKDNFNKLRGSLEVKAPCYKPEGRKFDIR
jgi:hypothetical protein